MADNFIHFSNDDTQNKPFFKRLDTELNIATNQNSIKVLKVIEPTNKKTLL